MTEAEWLASRDAGEMVTFVQTATTEFRTRWQGWRSAKRFAVSDRKWRLLACATLRRAEDLLADPDRFPEGQVKALFGHLDRWAETGAPHLDVASAISELSSINLPRRQFASAVKIVVLAVREGAGVPGIFGVLRLVRNGGPTAWVEDEALRQVDLVRCVLGNPFRPARLDPAWLAAHDGAARRVAASVYDGHAFTELPVLADALEDAGCTDAAALAHCRAPGPHVRGCWVVDLALGKQ